jgi:hypothetical protein
MLQFGKCISRNDFLAKLHEPNNSPDPNVVTVAVTYQDTGNGKLILDEAPEYFGIHHIAQTKGSIMEGYINAGPITLAPADVSNMEMTIVQDGPTQVTRIPLLLLKDASDESDYVGVVCLHEPNAAYETVKDLVDNHLVSDDDILTKLNVDNTDLIETVFHRAWVLCKGGSSTGSSNPLLYWGSTSAYQRDVNILLASPGYMTVNSKDGSSFPAAPTLRNVWGATPGCWFDNFVYPEDLQDYITEGAIGVEFSIAGSITWTAYYNQVNSDPPTPPVPPEPTDLEARVEKLERTVQAIYNSYTCI